MDFSTLPVLPLTASTAEFTPQANSWVKLREPLSAYSTDEALLLCEEADGQWVSWVPDFGVATLGRHQYYRLEK
ncbi:MAG: hypothetical protein WCA07_00955 [Gloeobacterales cyanobacterium]